MIQGKGFLFDLDGTLVNSLPVVERAYINWAKLHQLDIPTVLAFIHGKQAITSIRHFLPHASEAELQAELRQLEQIEAEDTDGVAALPGVFDLLNQLQAQQIPWAIVTSGTIPVAHARHQAAQLICPEIFITAELVKHGKPHPDPYLLGAAKLGLQPHDCIVVEDATAGVMSGLAAGCSVIAVNAPLPEDVQRDVHLVIDSLEQISVFKQDSIVEIKLK